MNEVQNSEMLYDRYADALAALVMDQYMTVLAESLAAEERASVEIDEALDSRCRRVIRKGLAKDLRRRIGKKLLRGAKVAALVTLLLCGVFAILFSTVEAIRVPIVNFFFEQKEEYPESSGKEQGEYDPGEDVLAGLLPEGYEPLECVRSSDGDLTIRYADAGDGKVFYDEFVLANGAYRGDTEDAVTEDIVIGGRDALLVEKNGWQVIWHSASGEVLYQLESNQLSREELISIAEAIESGREEDPPADGDGDLAEPTLPEYAPAEGDSVDPEDWIHKFDFPRPRQDNPAVPPSFGSLPIEIGDTPAESIPFYGVDEPSIETNDVPFVWSGIDGQQPEEDSIGWAVVP